jgi:hypothetical protein
MAKEEYDSPFRRERDNSFWKVLGTLALAGAVWVGGDFAWHKYTQHRDTKKAHEQKLSDESSWYEDAKTQLSAGDYRIALKTYEKAQRVFPSDSPGDSLRDPGFKGMILEGVAEMDSLDAIAAAEKAEQKRVEGLRAKFVPVEGDTTGLVEYKIREGQNLWSAADFYLMVRNLGEDSDSRSVSEVWGETYDSLLSKGLNPDSLEIGDAVNFRAPQDSSITSEKVLEEEVQEETEWSSVKVLY